LWDIPGADAPEATMHSCLNQLKSIMNRLRLLPFALAVWAAVLLLVVHGCNGTGGELVSAGAPLGDFRFEAKACRSGERLGFFGAVLTGERPGEGRLVLIDDAVQGRIVTVEAPGSCQPPDDEACAGITIDPLRCATYDVVIERTSRARDPVARMEGRLRLDCHYPGGGRVRADVEFSGCD
jgi:hypothetical protein